ncbi:MAG: non-ribosomal peptide synthetase [Gammaproteobacteria bacterium]|nr:non-ribosomal peptide synthetase [Gammaproteobacteria bacterium]MDH5659555.1 non-ribosomal peptide synthetase [Gammaproteobacteria bacterium]
MSIFTTLIDALEQHSTDERSLTYIEGKESETTITFKQLHQRALGMLHHFQRQGLKPGDELIIFLRNNEMFLDAFWGAIFGGIIPVPVAVGISDEHRSKLYKIYNKLQRPYVFTDNDNLERLKKYADENNLDNDFDRLKNTSVLSENMSDLSQQGNQHNAHADDICFIQFSSGSTSDPKGVVLTHRNLILNVLAKGAAGGYTKDDISLSWMPLTHDMGLIGFHINMIVCYMHHCIMATDLFSRRPGLWLQKVSEKRASVICSPNFGYKHFLKAMGDKDMPGMDLSCVRVILNGAEPISTRLCDEFLERLAPYGLKQSSMLPVYGLAEATLAVAFPKWGQDYRAVHVDRHKLKVGDKVTYLAEETADTLSFPIVGFAVPDMNIRIGDLEGKAFPEDTIGSILISGPTVTQGYYYDDDATKAVMTSDGWLDTGDLGFMHNKELVITGRSKEIIFANGQNYYPHDLESILIQSEGIELGKVAVYGIWEEKLQRDELLIFIIFRGDLKDFVPIAKKASHTLNEQAGLEVDYVIPVNRIPKTTSGKFQRRILADDFENGMYDEALKEIENLSQSQEKTSDEDLTPLQHELKEICNSIVEGRTLDINDNFFESGISSLMLAEIHQQIDDRYPDKVDIIDLFEYQTIVELEKFMQEKL